MKRKQSVIIRVKGYATMKRFTEHLAPRGEMEVPENSTVEAVLKMLNVPSRFKKIIMTNGRQCEMDHIFQQSDEFVFFPPLEGG